MKDKVLIITTCSTAITMYKRKDLAVPKENTKIVIAGDHK